MGTIYINGMKATSNDLALLFKRVRKGEECIVKMHITRGNNLAIITA